MQKPPGIACRDGSFLRFVARVRSAWCVMFVHLHSRHRVERVHPRKSSPDSRRRPLLSMFAVKASYQGEEAGVNEKGVYEAFRVFS